MAMTQQIARWWQQILEPGWVRPLPTPRQRRIDLLLVGLFLVSAAFSAVLINSMGTFYGGAPLDWRVQALWLLALAVPLIWRRRFPATVALLVSAAFGVSQYNGFVDNLMASVALFWALYSVGAWSRNRRVAFWIRVVIVVAMFAMLVVSLIQFEHSSSAQSVTPWGPFDPSVANVVYSLLINVGYFAAATFFGRSAWTSAKRQQVLEDQARAIAAAQEVAAQRAVMTERVHIARELHDAVAHHVSVMGVQASAARRVLGKSPELASDALSAVENTARVAITELRGLLGVLRDVTAVPSPMETLHAAPGVEQIPELIEQARKAGLQIRYGVYGQPRPVPTGISLSVFRIVQEALTNVIKHAGATSVDVRLRFLQSSIEVDVSDDGLGALVKRDPGGGYGLVGMRERVAVHGGELAIGPRDTVGYRVRATLPLPVVPDLPTAATGAELTTERAATNV